MITNFICSNGESVSIKSCLKGCPNGSRCLFLPTLRAIAKTLSEKKKDEFTVTDLISGTLESYLRKSVDYAVNPTEIYDTLVKKSIGGINDFSSGAILSNITLEDGNASTKITMLGKILDKQDGVLGDTKVVGSYKLMKALGYYKADVPTGEFYKTGARKGEPKTRKELKTDGVKDNFDWTLQMNYARMLLEKEGFKVNKMVIQVYCRDFGLKIAQDRGITKAVYMIEIPKISDRWLKIYFDEKAKRLRKALDTKRMPKACKYSERWQNRKCENYCSVAEYCPYKDRFVSEDNNE